MKPGKTGKGQAAARIPQTEHVPAPVEWTSAFTDPRLCAAIVDRLTYDAHIITTGAGSYRLRTTAARRQAGST